jgi:hypothetical protein
MTLLNLPVFLCHKKVGAARIDLVSPVEAGGAVLVLDTNPGNLQVQVDAAWLTRNPETAAGGYLVQYEDGYTAYSPKDAFESGYTLEEDADLYSADSVINLGQDIVDVKLLLSRIETTAVNEPHMVKALVEQAVGKLDELVAFFCPEEIAEGGGPTQAVLPAAETATIPGGTEVDAADVPNQPAEEPQAAESAPDTQEEKPVEQGQ